MKLKTHLDLFTGIGGFTIADRAAGFATVAFSEIEPYVCKILKQTWPKVTNLGDIHKITKAVVADSIRAWEQQSEGNIQKVRRRSGDGGAKGTSVNAVHNGLHRTKTDETEPSGHEQENRLSVRSCAVGLSRRGETVLDLITAGFPCQPYSHAGNRRGSEDDRALWPELLRVIQELRRVAFLGENVTGLVSMEQPDLFLEMESVRDAFEAQLRSPIDIRPEVDGWTELCLHNISQDLEKIGYDVWPIIVPACAVDARHRRDRVWIMAYANDRGRPWIQQQATGLESCSEVVADSAKCGRTERQSENDERESDTSRRSETVADTSRKRKRESSNQTNSFSTERRARNEFINGRQSISNPKCLDGHRGGHDSGKVSQQQTSTLPAGKEAISNHAGFGSQRQRSPRQQVAEAHGGQGISVCHGGNRAVWLPESGIRRVAPRIPNRSHRLKALGNAIVPQVAEVILKGIAKMMDSEI